MSDEEVVREALSKRWGGDYRFPGMPEQLWRDANDGLDRILSDRDSLRAALERIAELDEAWVVTDNTRGTHLVKLARQALTSSEKEKG